VAGELTEGGVVERDGAAPGAVEVLARAGASVTAVPAPEGSAEHGRAPGRLLAPRVPPGHETGRSGDHTR
jgi:hypothetical protein